jgi:hypothetical protein
MTKTQQQKKEARLIRNCWRYAGLDPYETRQRIEARKRARAMAATNKGQTP